MSSTFTVTVPVYLNQNSPALFETYSVQRMVTGQNLPLTEAAPIQGPSPSPSLLGIFLAGSYSGKATVQPLEPVPSDRLGWAEQGPALFSGADAKAWANGAAHRARVYKEVAAETRRAPKAVRLLVASLPAGQDGNDLATLLAYAKSLLARYSASKKAGQATRKGARHAHLKDEVLALPLTRDEAREARAWVAKQIKAKARSSSERLREDKRRREFAQDLILIQQVAQAQAATLLVEELAKENRQAPSATVNLASRIQGQTNPATGAIWTGNPKRERVSARPVKRAGLAGWGLTQPT